MRLKIENKRHFIEALIVLVIAVFFWFGSLRMIFSEHESITGILTSYECGSSTKFDSIYIHSIEVNTTSEYGSRNNILCKKSDEMRVGNQITLIVRNNSLLEVVQEDRVIMSRTELDKNDNRVKPIMLFMAIAFSIASLIGFKKSVKKKL